MQETLSPLVPFPELNQAGALAAIATSLDTFRTELLQGTLYKSWAKANPGESSRLEAYWSTPVPYPSMATHSGMAFRAAYEEVAPS